MSDDVNTGTLLQNSFMFELVGFDNVNFHTLSASIGGINVVDTHSKNVARGVIHSGGGNIKFEELEITFIVDSKMMNYLSIYNWMIDNRNEDLMVERYRQGALNLLNSQKGFEYRINYRDLLPVSLSTVTFDSTLLSAATMVATAKFVYNSLTFDGDSQHSNT